MAAFNIFDYNKGLSRISKGGGQFQGPTRPTDNTAYFRATGQTISNPGSSSQGVLGASTSNTNWSPPQQSFQQPQQQAQPSNAHINPSTGLWDDNYFAQHQQQSDPYAGLRNEIGTAWDQYSNSLNDVGNTFLPQQKTAQENIANTQLQQGQNQINTQKTQSLRDIAGNIRNAFQAGNVFLGAHGAGDSSAANQYSFAINQQAQKQTGQLNEFVNTQLQNLQSTHDQQVQGISQWFSEQQQAIKQAIASGQLQKSQDIQNLSRSILDQAIAASNQVKQQASDRYNALVGWAANNSQNVGQLQQNIAGIPQALGQPQQGQVDSSGNFRIPTGAGTFGRQNTDQFGNPI